MKEIMAHLELSHACTNTCIMHPACQIYPSGSSKITVIVAHPSVWVIFARMIAVTKETSIEENHEDEMVTCKVQATNIRSFLS